MLLVFLVPLEDLMVLVLLLLFPGGPPPGPASPSGPVASNSSLAQRSRVVKKHPEQASQIEHVDVFLFSFLIQLEISILATSPPMGDQGLKKRKIKRNRSHEMPALTCAKGPLVQGAQGLDMPGPWQGLVHLSSKPRGWAGSPGSQGCPAYPCS